MRKLWVCTRGCRLAGGAGVQEIGGSVHEGLRMQQCTAHYDT